MRRATLRAPKGHFWMMLFLASSAFASVDTRRPTITVGEVRARVDGADAATEATLRNLVLREVGRLEIDHPVRADTYVVSAALVRYEARASSDGARATCVVSATLRRSGNGALLALMRGSGVAEDSKTALEGAKARALEAAVHGAVRHLPDAL